MIKLNTVSVLNINGECFLHNINAAFYDGSHLVLFDNELNTELFLAACGGHHAITGKIEAPGGIGIVQNKPFLEDSETLSTAFKRMKQAIFSKDEAFDVTLAAIQEEPSFLQAPMYTLTLQERHWAELLLLCALGKSAVFLHGVTLIDAHTVKLSALSKIQNCAIIALTHRHTSAAQYANVWQVRPPNLLYLR